MVNIGDNQNLKWRRRMLKYDIVTGRQRWEVDKAWKEVMHMTSGTIVIVNALDEIPSQHPTLGILVQYQHGGVVVSGNKFSCGYVFRVVKNSRLYNNNNQVIVDGLILSEKNMAVMKQFDANQFHQHLIKLYRERFPLENFNITEIKRSFKISNKLACL